MFSRHSHDQKNGWTLRYLPNEGKLLYLRLQLTHYLLFSALPTWFLTTDQKHSMMGFLVVLVIYLSLIIRLNCSPSLELLFLPFNFTHFSRLRSSFTSTKFCQGYVSFSFQLNGQYREHFSSFYLIFRVTGEVPDSGDIQYPWSLWLTHWLLIDRFTYCSVKTYAMISMISFKFAKLTWEKRYFFRSLQSCHLALHFCLANIEKKKKLKYVDLG